jgi:hypothetical protein
VSRVDGRARGSKRSRGRTSSPSTMRGIGPSSRTCLSARRSTARSWLRPASPLRGRPAGSRTSRSCRSRTSARSGRPAHPRTRSGLSLRAGVRDSAHLLDERNDRRSQLRPADGARPRQLGDRLGAELRGIRRRRGPAHRVHIRRRAVRRRRGACRVRAHRTLPRSGRNPEHRASDPRGRAAQAEAVVLMPSSSIQGRDPLWRWMTARLGSSC